MITHDQHYPPRELGRRQGHHILLSSAWWDCASISPSYQ